MKIEIVNAIVAAAEEAGYDDVCHRSDYSGRGMMGKGTDAIVYGNESHFLQCVALAAVRTREQEDVPELAAITAEDFIEGLDRLQRDNISNDGVVY